MSDDENNTIFFVNKVGFIQIFVQEGNDEEWAEICWNRWVKSKSIEELTEANIRKAAQDWKKYADEGGF